MYIWTRILLTFLTKCICTPQRSVRDRIPVGTRFSARPDRPWGPPSLLYNGYPVFPGGKVRPGRDADHSPPSSAVVMEEKSYTSTHSLGHTGPVTEKLYLFIFIYTYISNCSLWTLARLQRPDNCPLIGHNPGSLLAFLPYITAWEIRNGVEQ